MILVEETTGIRIVAEVRTESQVFHSADERFVTVPGKKYIAATADQIVSPNWEERRFVLHTFRGNIPLRVEKFTSFEEEELFKDFM